MNISNFAKDLLIDASNPCNNNFTDTIIIHNLSVTVFTQSLYTDALLSILVKKGIITAKEYAQEFTDMIQTKTDQIDVLKSNRDLILESIASDYGIDIDLKEMFESLKDSEN